MRRPLVVGNWKMNTRSRSALTLATGIVAKVEALNLGTTEVAICPPVVYLDAVRRVIAASTKVQLGAQDVAVEADGAYTGEVSAGMLADAGCRFVIVGHSERRLKLAETDAVIALKFERAAAAGLTPIVCVGETLEQRQKGDTEATVLRQLDAVLALGGTALLARGLIAYEPVWAIGSGHTATPAQAEAVHACLRHHIEAFDPAVANAIRIVYGGSMKADNAAVLIRQPNIDGGLIGGASLQAEAFTAICKAAH